MKTDIQKDVYKKKIEVEIDLPVLKKFLLCLPLRPGLIVWGYLQLATTILISWYAILQFAENSNYYPSGFALVQKILMFVITMIISMLEVIFCMFLVLGAQKKNANMLEVCYYYLRVKIPVYALLLIISVLLKAFVVSDQWYYVNLDPWRNQSLMENQVLAVVDIALQSYLFLLVRSEIIMLEHEVNLGSLYQRLYPKRIQHNNETKPDLEQPKLQDYQVFTPEYVPVHNNNNNVKI